MENVRKNYFIKIIVLILIAVFITFTGCSNGEKHMTDDEIRQAIEDGDKTTLEQAKVDVKEAVDEALRDFDFNNLSEDQIKLLRTKILDNVDQKINNTTIVNRYTTVEQKGQSSSNNRPRIKDGFAIPVEYNIPRTLTKKNEDTISTFNIAEVTAQASNFSSDTPYAGGDYAYKIKVTVKGTYSSRQASIVDDSLGGETAITPVVLPSSLDIGFKLSPYDVAITDSTLAANASNNTFEANYFINVNMLPKSIYAYVNN